MGSGPSVAWYVVRVEGDRVTALYETAQPVEVTEPAGAAVPGGHPPVTVVGREVRCPLVDSRDVIFSRADAVRGRTGITFAARRQQ